MSPCLHESSVIRHFELSDAIETHNRIIFDFYMGLPHVLVHREDHASLLQTCAKHVG